MAGIEFLLKYASLTSLCFSLMFLVNNHLKKKSEINKEIPSRTPEILANAVANIVY